MRKIVLLLFGIILFACVREEILVFDDIPEELIVDALFRTDDTLHTVRVFLRASDGSVKSVSGRLSVECTIEGKPLIKAVEEDDLYEMGRLFYLPATFSSGDKVRLDVKGERYNAFSETVVPEPVILTLEDTVCTESPGINGVYNCSVRVHDRLGERTWLKAFPARGLTCLKDGKGGDVRECLLTERFALVSADNPVFDNDDFQLPSGLGGTAYNWYDLSISFSDRLFVDDSCVLTYESVRLRRFRSFHGASGYHYDEAYVEPSVLLPVGTMSEEVYKYMTKMDNLRIHTGKVQNMLSEPLILPDNIQGGVGFFGIINVSSLVIRFKDIFIASDIYI